MMKNKSLMRISQEFMTNCEINNKQTFQTKKKCMDYILGTI